MQSFVGKKLTHTSPSYYCSRSARPRALPAGLSGIVTKTPCIHIFLKPYNGKTLLQGAGGRNRPVVILTRL